MAADFFGTAGDMLGVGAGGGFDLTMVIGIVVLIIVFAIIAAVATYFIVSAKQFKLEVIIYEKIGGEMRPNRRDKAKRIYIGNGGDEALFLRKHRKILPMPTIQVRPNTFYYAISDDGEWVNFKFGDFDKDRKEMGATFLDKEMRYARTSLQYMSKERYDKRGFWEKYGGIVAYAALILVTAIGYWLLIDKMIDLSQASSGAVNAAQAVLEETKRILGILDTLTGGSGLSQA